MDKFLVDTVNSTDREFYIDIAGLGSVCITATDEGVSVDIHPLHVTDGPAATCYALVSDLIDPIEEQENA